MQTSAIQQLVYSGGFGKSAANLTFDSEQLLDYLSQGFSPISSDADENPFNSAPSYGTVVRNDGRTRGDHSRRRPMPYEIVHTVNTPTAATPHFNHSEGEYDPGSTGTGSLMDGIKGLYHRIKNRYDSLIDSLNENQRLGLGIGAGVLGGAGILGAMELYRRRQQEEEEHKMRMRAFRGY